MIVLITELFSIFGPIAVKIFQQWQATHDGNAMTDAQLVTEFRKNIETYLAEGAAWTATHPKKK